MSEAGGSSVDCSGVTCLLQVVIALLADLICGARVLSGYGFYRGLSSGESSEVFFHGRGVGLSNSPIIVGTSAAVAGR